MPPNDIPSNFDPQAWLESLETDQRMDTKLEVMPIGRYNFTVQEIKVKRITPDDAEKKPFQTVEFNCSADGAQRTASGQTLLEITGRERNFARYSGYADLNEAGNWDWSKGKNVAIGALREAVGQNVPGQSWKLGLLKGQTFSGEVYHKPNAQNPDRPYVEIRNPLPPQ